ncbi:Eco29kI family restriction endonuclease [Schaalia sp. Marseille-Q2122]|uniref:Eco29kI family restriction endonuclease n=1 Tax=Schaalia sp. Marseille-Q2122 TaxID=2736604 RepID=UPI00158844AF|nr:Eco29kI family restriction endonuclease [Schaalia sp. Marseille-Q2122]
MTTPYNPLDMMNLAKSVGHALLEQAVVPLGNIPKFTGAGIYAIYYSGNFPAYTLLSARNHNGAFDAPIYIGKAVPPGARKGGLPTSADQTTTALWNRLASDHAKSIEQVSNLDIADFHVRWLVIEPIWIPLGESILIHWFAPLWNRLVDGFGNHDPGKGRYNGLNTVWDTLHPGRPWAARLRTRPESHTDIAARIESTLDQLFAPEMESPFKVSSALPSFSAPQVQEEHPIRTSDADHMSL